MIRCLDTASRTKNIHCILKDRTPRAHCDDAECGGTAKFSSSMDRPSGSVSQPGGATSTGTVTERVHTCTEHAPVLDRPAPLRRFTRYYDAEYRCTDLHNYLLNVAMSAYLYQ